MPAARAVVRPFSCGNLPVQSCPTHFLKRHSRFAGADRSSLVHWTSSKQQPGLPAPEPWAAPGPVPLPPMLVTSMTRVPCSLAISLAICAMASCDPGWPLNIWLIAGFEFVICAFHAEKSTPAISFSPNRLSKSCISFTSGGSGAIQASVVTT